MAAASRDGSRSDSELDAALAGGCGSGFRLPAFRVLCQDSACLALFVEGRQGTDHKLEGLLEEFAGLSAL